MKTTIIQDKTNQYLFDVNFKGMTRGELSALKTALDKYQTAVGNDNYRSLMLALEQSTSPDIKAIGLL